LEPAIFTIGTAHLTSINANSIIRNNITRRTFGTI